MRILHLLIIAAVLSLPNGFFSGEEKLLAIFFFFSPDRSDYRSREMLDNEYVVAKIGVDPAENEPSKVPGQPGEGQDGARGSPPRSRGQARTF